MWGSGPLHATIVALDVERSAGRDDHLILQMRADLRAIVSDVLRQQSLDPAVVDGTDLGDGLRLIVPATIPPSVVLDPFVNNLAAALRRHRKAAAPQTALRLRMAVHMGLLHRDSGGWAGQALVHCARLLDSAPLREHLAAAHRADLALIFSQDIFEQVVRPGYGLDPATCGQVVVAVKETRVVAWVHVPGYPNPASVPVPDEPTDEDGLSDIIEPAAAGRRLRLAAFTGARSRRFWGGALAAAGWAVAGRLDGLRVVLAGVSLCLLAGVWFARPLRVLTWRSHRPEVVVRIVVGDLFAQGDADLVVGFTDTFDTSVTGDRIVARDAVQGQLLYRRFDGDRPRLDAELEAALAPVLVAGIEHRAEKSLGKLYRYPIGTVAVLGPPRRRLYLVAYSRMGNDLVPRSSVNDMWLSLSRLWDAVYEHGQRRPVAMPVVGSGLARIDQLSPEGLVQLILLSFVARSRESPICRELRIVIRPSDASRFDLRALRRYLNRM